MSKERKERGELQERVQKVFTNPELKFRLGEMDWRNLAHICMHIYIFQYKTSIISSLAGETRRQDTLLAESRNSPLIRCVETWRLWPGPQQGPQQTASVCERPHVIRSFSFSSRSRKNEEFWSFTWATWAALENTTRRCLSERTTDPCLLGTSEAVSSPWTRSTPRSRSPGSKPRAGSSEGGWLRPFRDRRAPGKRSPGCCTLWKPAREGWAACRR